MLLACCSGWDDSCSQAALEGLIASLGLQLSNHSIVLDGISLGEWWTPTGQPLPRQFVTNSDNSLISVGPFSPRAETTNGRAAMLGFGVLLLLEANSQVPFF